MYTEECGIKISFGEGRIPRVPFHIDAVSQECDALSLQKGAHRIGRSEVHLAGQLAIAVHNAVTWNSCIAGDGVQSVADGAGRSTGSNGPGNGTVGCHTSKRDLSDYIVDPRIEVCGLIGHQRLCRCAMIRVMLYGGVGLYFWLPIFPLLETAEMGSVATQSEFTKQESRYLSRRNESTGRIR